MSSAFTSLVNELVAARNRRRQKIHKATEASPAHARQAMKKSLEKTVESLGRLLEQPTVAKVSAPESRSHEPAEILAKALALQKQGVLTASQVAHLEAVNHQLQERFGR